jgi:Anp1 protein
VDSVLVLTPVKDARPFVDSYLTGLHRLTYPHDRLSLGVLESDSADDTFAALEARWPELRQRFRRAELWKKDFGYRLSTGTPRWMPHVQLMRRAILARSRNHLLMRALDDEDWVLWLDVDVIDFPADVVERLLATGRSIVQPHCVLDYGGPTFDRNAWRDHGRLHMDALREEGALVRLDAVGGTMLLVRADIHRDGLVFPSFPYGRVNPAARPDQAELETEGLGLMARDMGHQCWGMPNLEIRHARA